MTYFIQSNTTHAIAFGCSKKVMREFNGRLANAEGALLHPLLLVGIFAEIERKRHFAMVEIRLERLLKLVSLLSNYTSYQQASPEAQEEERHPVDPWLETHHIKTGLENWKSQLRKMTQHVEELPGKCWRYHEMEFHNKGEEAGQRIKERLEQIMIDYDEKIRACEMIMEGTTLATSLVLASGMYTQTASTDDQPQTHTKANIDIAWSTKKDGSQMKSIALLTMVFLPATFVTVSLNLAWLKFQ